MSTQRRDRKENRIVSALIIGAGAWALLDYTGPVMVGIEINVFSILPAIFVVASGAAILADILWAIGNVFDEKSAKTATGLKGTAGWVESLDEIQHDLIAEGWGPYWGTFGGAEVMAEIGSNSLVVGTTGSGKGVGMVQNNILSIHGSKAVPDFKGENACITARVLRERGEDVYILNIGDLHTDILGESAYFNPLCLVADNFWRQKGLRDISDDIHELGKQLDPEPVEHSQDGNKYFRNGSRNLIGFAIQMCVLINGYSATLGDVAAMLNDKHSLLRHAKWACGQLEKSDEQEQA